MSIPNRALFGSLRIVRAILGAYAAAAFVTLLVTLIQYIAGNVEAGALILSGSLFGGALILFVGMRRAINAAHIRRVGEPHPKMNRFAAL
jgi:hypothetical protein